MSKTVHLHMISDSTGETVMLVARASLVQFDDINTIEHAWNSVRSKSQVDEIMATIAKNPGFVLYTLVRDDVRKMVEDGCHKIQTPCISVLDPVVTALGRYLGAEIHPSPGRQHTMNDEYFSRIDALHFVLNHDDGQMLKDLNHADVVVLGVSRTSKTPTCIYLANRGIKAANIPIVPGSTLPDEVLKTTTPLIVGLTNDPKQLVQIRRNRLRMLKQSEATDYIDPETVARELTDARRLFTKHGWPVIDTTRKSIEEVAATILNYYNRYREQRP